MEEIADKEGAEDKEVRFMDIVDEINNTYVDDEENGKQDF